MKEELIKELKEKLSQESCIFSLTEQITVVGWEWGGVGQGESFPDNLSYGRGTSLLQLHQMKAVGKYFNLK